MSPGRSQSSVANAQNTVDAMLLAARGATVEREFRVSQLSRVSEMAVDDQAVARLSVRFHLIEARAAIAGRATASLRLVCQRCLGAVQMPVDEEFHVVLVASETEMDQLPDEQDAVIADVTRLDLSWLLEEQLLLALPLAPMHAAGERCAQNRTAIDDTVEITAADERESPTAKAQEAQRPFANLRNLLKQKPEGRSN